MLRTARLRLREPRSADRQFLVTLRTHPEVRQHLGGPLDTRAAAKHAEANLAEPLGTFVVVRLDTQQRIGLVVLHEGHGGIEVSYEFLPHAWGQGLASEAVGEVLQAPDDLRALVACIRRRKDDVVVSLS